MGEEEPAGGPETPKRHLLPWVIALLLITAVAVIAWQGYQAPRGVGLLNALQELLPKNPKDVHTDEQRIGQIILDNHREYRTLAINWSAVYFGCLFFSAVCAALAGVVIKLEFFLKNEGFKKDLAALLAMLSALLVTLSTAGGFHQHWWANRLAASKMEKLGYAFMTADWTDKKTTLDAFSSQIQTISYERNEEIGSSDNGKPEQPKAK
jgi:hypothetical protein